MNPVPIADYTILKLYINILHLKANTVQERFNWQQQLNKLRACLLSKLAIADVIKHHVFPTTNEAHHATHPTCGMHTLMHKTVAQHIGTGRRGNDSMTLTVQDSTDRGEPRKDALYACAQPSGDRWIIEDHSGRRG